MSERPSPRKAEGTLGLDRAPWAWLDRVLPARTAPFLAVVLGSGALVFGLGWLLASERGRLVRDAEWLVQPAYLAVHLALLRLFVTVYTTNLAAGSRHLDATEEEVRRAVRRVVGPLGFAVALVLAAPLVALDVRWMHGEKYLGTRAGFGPGGTLGAADWALATVWAVEWLVNAYVWVVVVGFLLATMHLLRHHTFRDPIERVLRERQYRPFLVMSAQGASLTLVFAAASVLYVLLTKGADSDYIGLWTTAGLVLVGFVPPWLLLKRGIGRLVDEEAEVLGGDLERAAALEDSGETDLRRLEARVKALLAMARLEHLHRLHDELGKIEGRAVLLRLLAPLGTVGWRILKPF